MAGLLNTSSVLMCPHGGSVSITTTNTRVKAGGDFAARSTDIFTVAGCAFNVAGALHPCVQVQWQVTALKSKAVENPTLTEQSVGLCVAGDQAVQGSVQIVNTQQKVAGQ